MPKNPQSMMRHPLKQLLSKPKTHSPRRHHEPERYQSSILLKSVIIIGGDAGIREPGPRYVKNVIHSQALALLRYRP